MNSQVTKNELQSLMASSPYIEFCGIVVIDIDHSTNTMTLSMPLKPDLRRAADTTQFHGGPIASLIDTAACLAVFACSRAQVSTINFRTDFLRPAMDGCVKASATVRKIGRSVAVVDVDVSDGKGALIAVGRATVSCKF